MVDLGGYVILVVRTLTGGIKLYGKSVTGTIYTVKLLISAWSLIIAER